MENQTKNEKQSLDALDDAAKAPESLYDHSEIERIELLATVTYDSFKDAIAMCGVNTLETGKSNAFAIYKTPGYITVSDPILSEPESVRRHGDYKKSNWGESTKVNEFMKTDSQNKQKLLYEWDEGLNGVAPRKDVWAYIMSFPIGDLKDQGLKAKDMQRPTRDMIDFFLLQDQLRPGFICGILTNDGEKSGLMLFKKSEKVEAVDYHNLCHIGYGENVGREIMLGAMRDSGVVYADIDLTCKKGSDACKLYDKRAKQAVKAIF